MPLTSILLEYTPDPVSDASPTYVTVPNDEWRAIEYWEGAEQEGGGFDQGGATIRLVNKARKWEPLYSTNVIDTHQRFRLTLNGTVEGEWFITGMEIEYPGGTEYSEVVVTCADGSEVLALDNLPSLDPPEAENFVDVICHFDPWGHWPLDDPAGTKMVVRTRTFHKGKGNKRRKVRRKQRVEVTMSEVVGVAGSSGTYKNTPLLGQPGPILGDPGTAVEFRAAEQESATVPADADDFRGTRELTVMCWANFSSVAAANPLIVGPRNTASAAEIFWLSTSTGPADFAFSILPTGGVAAIARSAHAPSTGVWYFVAGTWDGSTVRIYLDGVEDGSASAASMLNGNDGVVTIGAFPGVIWANATIGHAAIIEKALSADELMMIYEAGTERGFAQQTAGERIAALVDSPLWSEAAVQTTGREVMPRMMHGQPRLEEIEETMAAEGPDVLFCFEQGAPKYLGHEWRASSSVYNTVQATFGQPEYGELGVDSLSPVYDHETFNVAQVSTEGGHLQEYEDTTASAKRGRRVLDDYVGVMLTDDVEAESLAHALVAKYKDPARTVEEITVSGFDDARLAKLLSLKVGHLIRVNWSGETGARNGQTANIIRRAKSLDARERILRCTYRLSRGFDATDTAWRAGIVGYSEAGVSTVAA